MPSQTAWSLEFRPPLVRPIRRGTAPFEQAGGGAVRLEVGHVDHQLIWLAALRRQSREDLVEHAHAAPADEPVGDRLGRAILGRDITPAQTVADHEDDTADNPPIINPGYAVRQQKMRLDPAHLRLRQPDQIAHGNAS